MSATAIDRLGKLFVEEAQIDPEFADYVKACAPESIKNYFGDDDEFTEHLGMAGEQYETDSRKREADGGPKHKNRSVASYQKRALYVAAKMAAAKLKADEQRAAERTRVVVFA